MKHPKISLYHWATFSHTPTFGWYFTLLSLFLHKEHRLYNESRNVNLFCFSYSKRESGITDDGMLWRGKKYTLELFFMKLFTITVIKSKEAIPHDSYYE